MTVNKNLAEHKDQIQVAFRQFCRRRPLPAVLPPARAFLVTFSHIFNDSRTRSEATGKLCFAALHLS